MKERERLDEGIPSESQLTKQYGKGFNMLKKMGFKPGTGLGPSGDGIITPIEINMRRPGEGLKDNEGTAPKPKRDSKVKSLQPKRQRSEGEDSDVNMGEDETSSVSSGEESAVELSPEAQKVFETRQAVDMLVESRRKLQYQLFSIESKPDGDVSLESVQGIVRDCGMLVDAINDMDFLKRLINLLRDQYDSNPLWYQLDVELVITSAVSEMISRITEISEVSPALIESVHEMVIDDDHFARILEFQLLPPLALQPNFEIFKAVHASASAMHYQSIYSRFLRNFFHSSISDPKKDPSWLISHGWFDLVPFGACRTELLEDHVKPRLVSSSAPSEVLPWKPQFSAPQWKDIVTQIAGQLLRSLRKMDPTSPAATELLEVAVAWGEVVSPCVVGFLLVESDFLPKWFSIYKTSPEFQKMCKRILPLVARVAYHSPAKRVALDAVRSARGEPLNAAAKRRPGGPPPEFFAKAKSAAVLTESQQGKLSLGDVIREEGIARNVLVAPKPGMRENGCQVLRVGDKTVYWKDDSVFEKAENGSWTEVHIESVFS